MTTFSETVQVWHESRSLNDEFDNGEKYCALHGNRILLRGNPAFRPSTEQLAWHNDHVYRNS